jgi:hypothetical protein
MKNFCANTMMQAIAPTKPQVIHHLLGNGFRLCLLAPYLATIVNRNGQRQCTYVGFDNYAVAKNWLSQIEQRATLRRAKRLSTKFEIKIWGLSTEQIMFLWRQISSWQPQQSESDEDTKSLSIKAATKLVAYLENAQAITNQSLSRIMTECAGLSDAQGGWNWKDAYDAIEASVVMYIRANGTNLLSQSNPLEAIGQIENKFPTHTHRSRESVAMQQFSTPLPLAYLASLAARIERGDVILEPSAGTGLLAVWGEVKSAKLILNELCPRRREILKDLFDVPIHDHNAEQIDDYLTPSLVPTVILMNPPFCASPKLEKRNALATWNHLRSAMARLAPGGRLVAITANWFSPFNPDWTDYFERIQQTARVVFSAGIEGTAYSKHGTNIETRLTVFEKVPASKAQNFLNSYPSLLSRSELEDYIKLYVPLRAIASETIDSNREKITIANNNEIASQKQRRQDKRASTEDWGEIVELNYSIRDWQSHETELIEGIYEPYQPQVIEIVGAATHPTPLVQSVAMASVAPPQPSYRPLLPERALGEGLLSAIQLESVIYAGESHQNYLKGWYEVERDLDAVKPVAEGTSGAVRFRRGWYLGDGTGVGKGRQICGILLDNWLRGRKKALWLSKSDKLIEDARRDWESLGALKEQIVPLSDYRQGEKIDLCSGIIFATYATLRTPARQNKISRVEQLVDWLGKAFDGVIVFDEAHAMANAIAMNQERGTKKSSLQGEVGLKLQRALPDARILYVSATGATAVANLAYAERLGLWNSNDSSFTSREQFLSQIEAGGIAAAEVVARDLKALGLYLSRSLSYVGVEYQTLEHELTPQQVEIYDTYAAVFKVIHSNLDAALEVTNVVAANGKVRNGHARGTARSAFEGHKQRFFNFLVTSMKCPTLIRAIENDLGCDRAAVIQLISTNEALLDRRLAEIPTSEWGDLNVDITPREYIMDYLIGAFPTQLFEVYTDENGTERSRPVFDKEDNPVLSREALRQRDELVAQIAMLPPVPSALDSLVQHFGYENVAEVTGRSKRIVKETKDGKERLIVQHRSTNANVAETHDFMNDRKRILVFSTAGGTGRSYHADRGCQNQRQRVHYLLEAGWRADEAVQGLGRTHRSNQAQPPWFRPISTNVKGEKRFIATIAKRLDSLGALTKGQRQTGGQGIFRSCDNLESPYAKAALRELLVAIANGKLACYAPRDFQEDTGLSLLNREGQLKEELPPMSQFLNRLLALPIAKQNALFEALEGLIEVKIARAIESGTYEVGVETLKGESFSVLERQIIYTHVNGSKTIAYHLEQKY